MTGFKFTPDQIRASLIANGWIRYDDDTWGKPGTIVRMKRSTAFKTLLRDKNMG